MTEKGQCRGSTFLQWLGGGQGVCLQDCMPLHVWWNKTRPPREQLAQLGLLLWEAALGCRSCGARHSETLVSVGHRGSVGLEQGQLLREPCHKGVAECCM